MVRELELEHTEAKKRTALYMDISLYEKVAALAEQKNVSVNRAMVYVLLVGLDTLES